MPQDPQVRDFIARSLAFYPADAYQGSIAQSRTWYERYAAHMAQPLPPDVETQSLQLAPLSGGPALPARRYRLRGQRSVVGTTVLYVHGGGFVLGGLDSHADVCAGLCQASGLDVVACTYRLAPEHRHPAQLDDVANAFAMLCAQGQRVILCGDSAGANLAAGLCLRLQAQGAAPAAGQVLIYPGLGGDATQGSYLSRAHAPLLSAQECAYYFSVRAQGLEPGQQNSPEMRPLLAPDLRGTPPTLVVTADLDPLRDDGLHYAERLQACGGVVQYRNEAELVHGYLRARHMSWRAADSFAAIATALTQMARNAFAASRATVGLSAGTDPGPDRP